MLEIYFKKLSESKTVSDEIPRVLWFISGMCGCVWVPEDVGVPAGELMVFGPSVGGGAPAAEVVVKLWAAFVCDSEVAPAEVSFLAAGLRISETSGQEPSEPGAADPPAWLCRVGRVGVGDGGLVWPVEKANPHSSQRVLKYI